MIHAEVKYPLFDSLFLASALSTCLLQIQPHLEFAREERERGEGREEKRGDLDTSIERGGCCCGDPFGLSSSSSCAQQQHV